jgi:hypothetical protein
LRHRPWQAQPGRQTGGPPARAIKPVEQIILSCTASGRPRSDQNAVQIGGSARVNQEQD